MKATINALLISTALLASFSVFAVGPTYKFICHSDSAKYTSHTCNKDDIRPANGGDSREVAIPKKSQAYLVGVCAGSAAYKVSIKVHHYSSRVKCWSSNGNKKYLCSNTTGKSTKHVDVTEIKCETK